MKKILHVSASPRGQAAESYRLSSSIVGCLLQTAPEAVVVERMLGAGREIPSIDEAFAISQHGLVDISQDGSMALSEVLVREVESADVLVIGTPIHNYTVPAALKAWIDLVVRVRRTFNVTPAGKVGVLRDRPVLVAVASGGLVSREHARQPDFLTPYLKAILGMIGLHDLTFFYVQGTTFGPDYLADSRAKAERAVQAHFLSFPQSHDVAPEAPQVLEIGQR